MRSSFRSIPSNLESKLRKRETISSDLCTCAVRPRAPTLFCSSVAISETNASSHPHPGTVPLTLTQHKQFALSTLAISPYGIRRVLLPQQVLVVSINKKSGSIIYFCLVQHKTEHQSVTSNSFLSVTCGTVFMRENP